MDKKEYLSTSAVAKQLKMPVKAVFALLKDYEWIRREGDRWVLAGKGEFEGGIYNQHPKFGEYIAWPETILQHPMLRAAKQNHFLNASQIGSHWKIPGRLMNRLLSELAWIKLSSKGWELTDNGRHIGGVQLENDDSGALYCSWPDTVLENTELLALIARLDEDESAGGKPVGLDGHCHKNSALKRLCDWLYLHSIAHACGRPVGDSEHRADFYLPAHHLFIEVWEERSAAAIATRLQRENLYREAGVNCIEVEAEDLASLDHDLAKLLREQGLKVY